MRLSYGLISYTIIQTAPDVSFMDLNHIIFAGCKCGDKFPEIMQQSVLFHQVNEVRTA